MADVNNKLRLQIVTQLDAAGIKATKEQVDQLELGLRRAGNTGEQAGQKFGALEKALGKMPGPIGKIGSAIGGLGGSISLIIGALTMGIEIGNKIYEKFVGPLQDWIYGTKELEKAEKAYEDRMKQMQATLDENLKAEKERRDAMAKSSESAIKAIDNETAAYLRQANVITGIKKAQGNAEMMRLEAAKFEEMSAYSRAGNNEAAEQIGRYYDVLIAELDAKQQLAAFDRESVKINKEQADAEKAYAIAAENVAKAKDAQIRAQTRLDSHIAKKGVGGMAVWDNKYDETVAISYQGALTDANEKLAKAEKTLADTGKTLEHKDAKALQRQLERANLAYAGRFNVERAAQAYDDYALANGNPLNAVVDQNWVKDMLAQTKEAEATQREILDVVKELGERFERLLEIK